MNKFISFILFLSFISVYDEKFVQIGLKLIFGYVFFFLLFFFIQSCIFCFNFNVIFRTIRLKTEHAVGVRRKRKNACKREEKIVFLKLKYIFRSCEID